MHDGQCEPTLQDAIPSEVGQGDRRDEALLHDWPPITQSSSAMSGKRLRFRVSFVFAYLLSPPLLLHDHDAALSPFPRTQTDMHFLHTLSAPVLISTLVSVCLSSPLAQSQAPFAVKEPAHGGRRYLPLSPSCPPVLLTSISANAIAHLPHGVGLSTPTPVF